MRNLRILIVDDESTLVFSLKRFLENHGYSVTSTETFKGACELIHSDPFDICLVDLRLPDGSGLELLDTIRRKQPRSQSIVLSGYGTIDDAVAATRKGAFHFLTKPFNLEELIVLINRAKENVDLKSQNDHFRDELSKKYQFDNIVGQSPEVQNILEMIERVSGTDATVLITGESGTGKELVAQAIHYNSQRADKLIIPINCGAIPNDLLESELFGHARGAFTGAIANRTGRFELADGGTVFLDEIAEMSPTLQVKLLRVLQERKFQPVGSARTVDVDVRIIAATNRVLEEDIKDGSFREDLYYRLNVIPIHVPPLRERRSDIPVLIYHFIKRFNNLRSAQIEGITPQALELLSKYSWPGNIRELENLIERIAIIKRSGIVGIEDLPGKYGENHSDTVPNYEEVNIPDSGIDFNSLVDKFENRLILKALDKTNWNRNQAAQLLGLNRTTLVEKIKKKGLHQDDRDLIQNAPSVSN